MRQRVVIIGGGFAGVNLLNKLDPKKFEVVLVDRNNYHSFPPLFYQVASSGLEPGSISFPLRREMRKFAKVGWRYHFGEVKCVDTSRKIVETQYEQLPYDIVVIAAGSTNNFFNLNDIRDKVFTLKSTTEAMSCRNEILRRLELACVSKNPEERRKLLTFTVIGGGATGVEVAGAIGEMKRYIIPREYKALNRDEITVTLVEGADRVLRTMVERSSAEALEYLKHLMVDVRLGVTMESYNDNVLHFTDGSELYSEMVIWTAGIVGEKIPLKGCDVVPGLGGRFVVDEFNRVKGAPEGVYAVGDICIRLDDPDWSRGLPQVAQVAIQQAHTLGRNLNDGRMHIPFKYNDKGTMATVGRNRAVVDIGKIHMYGRPAWFTWMFVHLISILGMRNRITVLINWIWAYFTYGSSLRLLFKPTAHDRKEC